MSIEEPGFLDFKKGNCQEAVNIFKRETRKRG
jgi:hypothetical protein